MKTSFGKIMAASMVGFLLASILSMIIFFMIIGGAISSLASLGESEKPKIKSESVLKLDLSLNVPDKTPANPFETHKSVRSSFEGIKYSLRHLKDGGALGIFPAGEVSSYQHESGVVQDREWQTSILKFIKKAEVPIVPLYFHGTNSRLFHLLGQVHPLLRTAKLPSELFNKKNKLQSSYNNNTSIPMR